MESTHSPVEDSSASVVEPSPELLEDSGSVELESPVVVVVVVPLVVEPDVLGGVEESAVSSESPVVPPEPISVPEAPGSFPPAHATSPREVATSKARNVIRGASHGRTSKVRHQRKFSPAVPLVGAQDTVTLCAQEPLMRRWLQVLLPLAALGAGVCVATIFVATGSEAALGEPEVRKTFVRVAMATPVDYAPTIR
ncbi:MAG: hypothetical protein KUG77_18620, partial [Nannocystaceae bacterium]|nr:hypothetical protein [Nannocystaceae bacterium]